MESVGQQWHGIRHVPQYCHVVFNISNTCFCTTTSRGASLQLDTADDCEEDMVVDIPPAVSRRNKRMASHAALTNPTAAASGAPQGSRPLKVQRRTAAGGGAAARSAAGAVAGAAVRGGGTGSGGGQRSAKSLDNTINLSHLVKRFCTEQNRQLGTDVKMSYKEKKFDVVLGEQGKCGWSSRAFVTCVKGL